MLTVHTNKYPFVYMVQFYATEMDFLMTRKGGNPVVYEGCQIHTRRLYSYINAIRLLLCCFD